MLQQKITEFKEYVMLRRQFKKLEKEYPVAFKTYIANGGKIVILKTKELPNAKPRTEFWGLTDYPCIILHQGDEISQNIALMAGKSDMIRFYCPNYSPDAPCTNKNCMHWTENQKHFSAEKEWHKFSEKYDAAKKQFVAAREQLFGNGKRK